MARPWKDRIICIILISASKRLWKPVFPDFFFMFSCTPWNPYLDFEIFRPVDILVGHFFLLNLDKWQGSCGSLPPWSTVSCNKGPAEGQNCSWRLCFPAHTAGCSSKLWPPLSSLTDAAGRLAFQLHLAYGTPKPENRCRLAWGYVLEVAGCLVPRLANIGQGEVEWASILKGDLTYLDLRGKIIHSLLLSKHLTNLEHQSTSKNDNKW